MTDDVEWYIARDGQQHGPLSAAEMKKFIELGHLKATDLVWRAGFADWRNGLEVFPEAGKLPTSPAPPPRAPSPDPANRTALQSNNPPQQSTTTTQRYPQPDRMQPGTGRPVRQAEGQNYPAPSQSLSQLQHPDSLNARSNYRQGPSIEPQRDPRHSGARQGPAPANGTTPGPRARPITGPGRTAPARPSDTTPPRRRSRALFWSIAALFALLLMGALAWIGFRSMGPSNTLVSARSLINTHLTSAIDALTNDAASFSRSPFSSTGSTREELEADLQRHALWKILKTDHPDWYKATVQAIHQQRLHKQPEEAITAEVAKALVALRRQNGRNALAASTASFVRVAQSFTANLKALEAADKKVCYDYISFGEGGASVVKLTANAKVAESLHRQLFAVFQAVRDGRKSPKAYGTAIREDYDVLSKTLADQYGWKPVDLQVFSNPELLSKAPPEKVCSMVQDWFTAQINLKDEALRSRLLFESLRPLFAG